MNEPLGGLCDVCHKSGYRLEYRADEGLFVCADCAEAEEYERQGIRLVECDACGARVPRDEALPIGSHTWGDDDRETVYRCSACDYKEQVWWEGRRAQGAR